MHGPVGHVGFESNAPESDVTLWIDWPVFVHTTVVPAVTVIDAGEKPKSTIETCAVAAGTGVGAVVVVVRSGANGSINGPVVVLAGVLVGVVAVVVAPTGAATGTGAVRAWGAAAAAGATVRRNAPRQPAPVAVIRRSVPPIIEAVIRTAPPMRSRLPA
jgi:hypothetical protein